MFLLCLDRCLSKVDTTNVNDKHTMSYPYIEIRNGSIQFVYKRFILERCVLNRQNKVYFNKNEYGLDLVYEKP